jgi:putative spermidine/putrescine transport system ATP-binding protein
MPAIQISGLTKRYGEAVAVAPLDLSVGDGEFLTLLGPSGCGKTTLMRMIAGITQPDGGTVVIAGRSMDGLPPERRNVGLVFQSYALFPHMTVAANIAFGLKMRRVSRAETARRVQAALALVDLVPLAGRYPRELSGGQQQRVALARAVVIEPDVLLLDEPLSNLDAKLREQLRAELRELQQRLGVTAIYVTHDQAEAMALADRIVVMDKGRIVEEGAPVTLYRNPRTRFAAEFLGQTNVVPVAVAGGRVVLPWGESVAAGAGDFVSIRPEDIAIAPGQGGTVLSRTFLGASVEYSVALADTVLRVRDTGTGAAILEPGAAVRLSLRVPPHVLDAAHGTRAA